MPVTSNTALFTHLIAHHAHYSCWVGEILILAEGKAAADCPCEAIASIVIQQNMNYVMGCGVGVCRQVGLENKKRKTCREWLPTAAAMGKRKGGRRVPLQEYLLQTMS